MWKYRDTDEQKRLVKFTIAKTMRLALEYPELAQEYFDSLCKVIPDNERITVSNYQHNLTSDAEGEEMLIVSRKEIQQLVEANDIVILKAAGIDNIETIQAKTVNTILNRLFGSKCLPDELNEDNFAKSEPKPSEPKFKVGDKVRIVKDITHENEHKGDVTEIIYVDRSDPDVPYKVDIFDEFSGGLWYSESDLAPYTEPKFKVGDKVTVIDYNKGLPNLSRCEHKIFTVATVKWENGGHMYTLKTNEKLFKKSDYLDHLDWCEDYLEPYVEPEINTFKDLRKSGKYNRYLLCNDRYQEIALECMNPYERKMFATGIIAQLKEYYGGMVPFPQPIGCAKIVLCPDAEKFEVDIYRDWDALMTFHNIEQAERFLKYNEQLVRDYYMLPRKEESC